MDYFGVPKLRKWFRNEINHSTPLDPKRGFGVFRTISQIFGTLNEAKLVFRAWMHYFKVPKLWKWFCNEKNYPNPTKRCLRVFWSVSQTFGTLNEVKLVFRAWMHYFRVPKLRKWFHNEINHSTPLDPKRCLRVFCIISQTFYTSNEAKLVFRDYMHFFRVPKLRKWFRYEINHSTPLNPNNLWECFGAFLKPSARQTWQNLCFGLACTI